MSYQKIPKPPREDILRVLNKSSFASLDNDDILSIAGLCEYCFARSGECIRSDNSASNALFLILEGEISLYGKNAQKPIAVFHESESFGLLSLLFPGTLYPNAYATEDTTFIMLDAVSFRMLELSNPKLAIAILRCIQTALTPLVINASKVLQNLCD